MCHASRGFTLAYMCFGSWSVCRRDAKGADSITAHLRSRPLRYRRHPADHTRGHHLLAQYPRHAPQISSPWRLSFSFPIHDHDHDRSDSAFQEKVQAHYEKLPTPPRPPRHPPRRPPLRHPNCPVHTTLVSWTPRTTERKHAHAQNIERLDRPSSHYGQA